jgi:hypothetical protein
MRSPMPCVLCALLLAACDATTDASDPLSNAPNKPVFATAGNIVDPNTLIPVPPPGAVCRADGNQTICHTEGTTDLVNEPAFDLTCGTVYETSHAVRSGIRWYNSEGKLVKRFFTQDVEGTWSLSPTGSGPTATLSLHNNFTNLYAVPGDEGSATQVEHGEGSLRAPGFGVIVHGAGLDEPDGTHHGAFRFIDDPAVAAEGCTALTP